MRPKAFRSLAHRVLALAPAALALEGGCAVPALAAAPSPEESPHWLRVLENAPEDAPAALASDGAGRLAVGGARGVRALFLKETKNAPGPVGKGVPETLLRRGPVADLAFLDDGSLLVATGQGLYRVERDGRTRREPLQSDADVRVVSRLDAARGLAVAATDAGVFVREPDAQWRRVRVLPSAAVAVVALRPRGADLELWSVMDGELWIAGLHPGASVSWRFAQRVPLPVAHDSDGAVDVAFDLPGADAVLVFPTRFAVRSAEGDWRSMRPALPPGARATRIARAFSRLWLATDHGLLSARQLAGPWRRAASPVGSLPVIGLVGGATLAVATHRGVLVAEWGVPVPARVASATPPGPGARSDVPPIGVLQRAALLRQGLEPERIADLRRRVSRRGLWPQLRVTLGYKDQRGRGIDDNQTFTYDALHSLHDVSRDRAHDLDAELSLTWDLGDAVYNPDEVDVSREARSVIALRDDVLDEVTQLYFERQRVMARLRSAAPDDPERGALALRAAELAAGLDAWTGGAFTRARRDPPDPTR